MPATPDRAAHPCTPGGALAFDFGTRRIGVAVGQRTSATARALTTLAHDDWVRMDALIAEWQPEFLLIGLPLALDGSEQAMSRAAREFADTLRRRYARPVQLIDERYTSREATQRFAAQRARGAARRKDACSIDAIAAEIILEAWLAQEADIHP